tara:strand:- start:2979 stop:3998 length:1020 start_codon:yes stop_codon:yes gene_type:complete
MKVKSINDNTLEFVLKRKTYVKFALNIDNLGNLEGKNVTTQLLKDKDNEEKLLQSSVPYLQEPERKILEKFSFVERDAYSLLDTLFPRYNRGTVCVFCGHVEHCIIQDVDVLVIREEENTGFITLNEYGQREDGTKAHSFKLQLLSKGFGIEIGQYYSYRHCKDQKKAEVEAEVHVCDFFCEKRYPIEFAIRRDKYKKMPPWCIFANITPPCDPLDPLDVDIDNKKVGSNMGESELRSKLMDVIVQLSKSLEHAIFCGLFNTEALNLHDLPGDLQREILSFGLPSLSVSELDNVIRGFMSQCEPLENLFLGSTATYFIQEYPWSTNVGEFIKYSIYKKI